MTKGNKGKKIERIVDIEAAIDYLYCPRRFELMHCRGDVLSPPVVSSRARRSKHFQESMQALLLFFLFRSMSGQPIPLATLLTRWGKHFLKDYDNSREVLHESHEVSLVHANVVSLNTAGVNAISDFYSDHVNRGYRIIEIMRSGIVVMPSSRRVRAVIHYVRSGRDGVPEVVYLYTGLQKPPLRLYTWPLLAAGLLYEQEYGVRPRVILLCPATQPKAKEYRLDRREGMLGELDEILRAMYESSHYLPDYAGSCAGCPASEACDLSGWRGLN